LKNVWVEAVLLGTATEDAMLSGISRLDGIGGGAIVSWGFSAFSVSGVVIFIVESLLSAEMPPSAEGGSVI
jgi:hypothetical protein